MKAYATISTNSTKSQPNQNRKIATSPQKAKGKYVEEYMIYGLDLVDDYTLPNFAFDAMLKLRPSILLYFTLPNFAASLLRLPRLRNRLSNRRRNPKPIPKI